MTGAPIGVEPRNTTEYRAMTRPRMAGPAASCMEALTPAANVTVAMPSGTSATTCQESVGASAASSCAAPNSAADPTSRPGPVRLRAPAASAPRTEPAPMALVRSA